MTARRARTLFFIIFALALCVRVLGLERSFVTDEFRVLQYAGLKGGDFLPAIETDSYPPLTYLAMSAWVKVSSADSWARLLFVILGMLSVSAVYLIGRELAGHKYALLAAFLMSIMPMQVWVSQYIRGIGPSVFFSLASTFFFIKLAKEDDPAGYLLNASGYAIAAIAAIYSFYFAFFVIAAHNVVYLIINRRNLPGIAKWTILQLIIFISFFPWIGFFLKQMKSANVIMNFTMVHGEGLNPMGLQVGAYLRAISGAMGLDQTFFMNYAVSKSLPAYAAPAFLFLFLILASAASIAFFNMFIKFLKKDHLKEKAFLPDDIMAIFSFIALLPLAVVIILNIFFRGPVAARYFAVSSAFLIFVYAALLLNLKNKKLFYLILSAFFCISLLRICDLTKPVIDYKGAALFVKNNMGSGECLLFIQSDDFYAHYAPFPKRSIYSADYINPSERVTAELLDRFVDKEKLRAMVKPYNSIWVYHSGEKMIGITDHVLNLLRSFGYTETEEFRFRGMNLFKITLKDRS